MRNQLSEGSGTFSAVPLPSASHADGLRFQQRQEQERQGLLRPVDEPAGHAGLNDAEIQKRLPMWMRRDPGNLAEQHNAAIVIQVGVATARQRVNNGC